MRLIDADRLLEGTEDHQFIDTHVIWNSPTVDAIPIEWLRKRYKTEGCYGTDEYFRKAYAVKEIIADWQAEQRREE